MTGKLEFDRGIGALGNALRSSFLKTWFSPFRCFPHLWLPWGSALDCSGAEYHEVYGVKISGSQTLV